MQHQRWWTDVATWDDRGDEWDRALATLPAEEQRQVTRYLFSKDRKLALASRLLQRRLVSDLFDVAFEDVDIRRTPESKPFWYRGDTQRALATWNFNVSHHGSVVAIVSHPRALVGVDVVRTTDRPRGSADEFFRAFADHFTPLEWNYIRGQAGGCEDDQYCRFYRLWSLKEAYIKAIGIGLGFTLLRAEFSQSGDQWRMRLDGQLADEWTFECTQLGADHLVSVAYGPPNAVWSPETSSIFSVPIDALERWDPRQGDEEQQQAAPTWRTWQLSELLPALGDR